jgi:energy-coupling factor transporter ATP-binding protein EcfA2
MKVTFAKPHLSIEAFPECELPEFTLITGRNGCGKTHLLQAIKAGNVTTSVAPSHENDIRFYDWTSIVPNTAEAFDSHGQVGPRAAAYQSFLKVRDRYKDRFPKTIAALSLPEPYASAPFDALPWSDDDLTQACKDEQQAAALCSGVDAAFSAAWQYIEQRLQQPPRATRPSPILAELKTTHFRRLFRIDRTDFFDAIAPTWGKAEPFQQSFAQLFVAYRDLLLENKLRRVEYSEGHSQRPALTDAAFRERYNVPPWDFVNAVLKDARLDFTIDAPDVYSYAPYKPALTKQPTGVAVEFTNLSSGEKVLMSFALCVYYAQDTRQVTKYPRLLLLDEVDAPMHPSMCQMLMRTITGTLVAKHGMTVVLTTHSPTTVALAPESAIHMMRGPREGLKKITKAEALNVLTEDVPTVSLDFEGRRQVFVESSNDASVYEKLYRAVRTKLSAGRSLEFIGVGKNPGNGSGCDQVKHVVANLTSFGNRSVFGLVDWDSTNTSDDRVTALGEGRRYSLENFLYDPLLLAILVVRVAPHRGKDFGLVDQPSSEWFRRASPTELQSVTDAIVRAITGNPSKRDAQAKYVGGLSLATCSSYLTMRGHDLEKRVLTVFAELNKHNSHTGDLLRYLAAAVAPDFVDFLPVEIAESFERVLTCPAH